MNDLLVAVQRLAKLIDDFAQAADPRDARARHDVADGARRLALEVELAAGAVLVAR